MPALLTSDFADKIIFLVDELSKHAHSGSQTSPIPQVLDIAERGRSLGVILVSPQQFMNAVHGRVTGNSDTKILGSWDEMGRRRLVSLTIASLTMA